MQAGCATANPVRQWDGSNVSLVCGSKYHDSSVSIQHLQAGCAAAGRAERWVGSTIKLSEELG